jgi:predicted CopG family antitoxin
MIIKVIKMENTTIAIKKDIKEKLMEFASKRETYSDVIERLLESAQQRLLNDVLFNEKGFIPIEEAMAEARKKWPKSK